MGWARLPRIATCAPGAGAGSVRAARDFTVATLHRWGVVERSHDIVVVVSELVTSALRHALPGHRDAPHRRPIRLGLLQLRPCVLCAVADPDTAAPVPRPPGSLGATGRGLHIICALSDRLGLYHERHREGRMGRVHRTANSDACGPMPEQRGIKFWGQHSDDRGIDRQGGSRNRQDPARTSRNA